MESIYIHEFKVKPEDLDEQQHVNNVVYLQWIQDVAQAHWLYAGSSEVLTKYAWVVMRHEIDYRIPALMGDSIIAKTWVERYEGAKSWRAVKLYRKRDDKLLAESLTTWCLLSAATKKPLRIGPEIISLFYPKT